MNTSVETQLTFSPRNIMKESILFHHDIVFNEFAEILFFESLDDLLFIPMICKRVSERLYLMSKCITAEI